MDQRDQIFDCIHSFLLAFQPFKLLLPITINLLLKGTLKKGILWMWPNLTGSGQIFQYLWPCNCNYDSYDQSQYYWPSISDGETDHGLSCRLMTSYWSSKCISETKAKRFLQFIYYSRSRPLPWSDGLHIVRGRYSWRLGKISGTGDFGGQSVDVSLVLMMNIWGCFPVTRSCRGSTVQTRVKF